jgi:hypothetical protein
MCENEQICRVIASSVNRLFGGKSYVLAKRSDLSCVTAQELMSLLSDGAETNTEIETKTPQSSSSFSASKSDDDSAMHLSDDVDGDDKVEEVSSEKKDPDADADTDTNAAVPLKLVFRSSDGRQFLCFDDAHFRSCDSSRLDHVSTSDVHSCVVRLVHYYSTATEVSPFYSLVQKIEEATSKGTAGSETDTCIRADVLALFAVFEICRKLFYEAQVGLHMSSSLYY